jgi:hypothetical protein
MPHISQNVEVQKNLEAFYGQLENLFLVFVVQLCKVSFAIQSIDCKKTYPKILVLEEKIQENIKHTRKCQKLNEALISSTYQIFQIFNSKINIKCHMKYF